MINKVKTCGIVYEIKIGKKVNWCVLIEWTICDQLCRLQSLELALQCKKLRFVAYQDIFVDSDKEEEEDLCLTTICQNHQTNNKFMFLRRLKSYALQSGKNTFPIYNETF